MTVDELEALLNKISIATKYDKEICRERLIDNDFNIKYTIEELKAEYEDEQQEDN